MTAQKQRISLVAWLAIVAIIVGLIGTQPAFAQEEPATCTAATLSGLYIFDASGFTALQTGWTPKAVVESLRFSGDGTLSAVATANVGGNLIVGDFHHSTGTYTVNQDCTGTLAFNPHGPHFDIFIAPRGTTFHMIQTDPSNVLAGEARRVSR